MKWVVIIEFLEIELKLLRLLNSLKSSSELKNQDVFSIKILRVWLFQFGRKIQDQVILSIEAIYLRIDLLLSKVEFQLKFKTK